MFFCWLVLLPAFFSLISCASVKTCADLKDFYNGDGHNVRDCAEWNKHIYWRFENHMTWKNAEIACQKASGHLVSIHSFDERRLVNALATNNDVELGPWIGMHRSNFKCSGEMVWSDGSAIDYDDWLTNQPDCYEKEEGCGHILSYRHNNFAVGTGWNDLKCDNTVKSICKKKLE